MIFFANENENGKHKKKQPPVDSKGKMDRATACALFAPHGPSTPHFSFRGRSCWARVVDVHDGDTVSLVLPMDDDGGRFHRFNVRLQGIDACELRSGLPELRDLALRARSRLAALCQGSCHQTTERPETGEGLDGFPTDWESTVCLVWAECHDLDKYGRVLATLRSDPEDRGPSFGERLCQERLAYPYRGATKLTEAEQLAALGPTKRVDTP